MHYMRKYRTGSAERRLRVRPCVVCMVPIWLEGQDRLTCSDACRKKLERMRRKGVRPRVETLKARDFTPERPRPKPVVSESFTVADVWARSDGTCPWCGGPLDRGLPAWDAMAGVPAWRVPLSDGGERSLRNRIIVHRSCWNRRVSQGG